MIHFITSLSPIDWVFIITIFALLTVDIRTYLQDDGRNHKSLSGQMTGVGILGTFVGIVIGLQEIDFSGSTDQAKDGIAHLLEGVKTSFVSSVVGLGAALGAEVVHKCKPQIFAKDGNEVADTLKDFMGIMESSFCDLKQSNQDVASSMDNLKLTMASESEKTRKALEIAIESLSKGASEEIISALQKVIQDFNQNLTDQFGENFKQLNEACLLLVQWQQDYQTSITESKGALELSAAAMNECSQQFEATLERKQEFVDVVSSTKDGIQDLNKAHESSIELAKNHADAINLQSKSIQDVQSVCVSFTEKIERLATQFHTLAEHSEVHNKKSHDTLKVNEDHFELARKMAEHLDSQLNQLATHQKEVNDSINATVKALSEGNSNLHGNLDQSLNELENSLSALTRDFAKAYNQYLNGLTRLGNIS